MSLANERKYTKGVILMDIHQENINELKTMRENLKRLRKQKGWSIEELSQASKIGKSILAGIEVDKNFKLDYLFTLCQLYGINVQEIFFPMK